MHGGATIFVASVHAGPRPVTATSNPLSMGESEITENALKFDSQSQRISRLINLAASPKISDRSTRPSKQILKLATSDYNHHHPSLQ